MQLKTYQAKSMREVMRLVRDELGDEAVIISTVEDGGLARATAALERPDPDPDPDPDPFPDPAPATPPDTGTNAGTNAGMNTGADAGAGRIAAMLDYHGVTTSLSDRLIQRADAAGSDDPGLALAAALDQTFRFAPIPDRDLARPLMLVGPPGAGKTVTTAKLAARLVIQGLKATVVNADVSRAAATAQLAAITAILGVQLECATTPAELARVVSADGASDAVFVDSFAVNPFAGPEMARLGDFIAASGAEPVVVLPAGLDAIEAADIAEAFADLGVARLITTRIDQARRLGSVLTAAFAGGLAIADAGVTPHVAHGLTALNPVCLARLLCRDPDAANPDPVQEEVQK